MVNAPIKAYMGQSRKQRVTICVNVRGIQGFPGGSMVKNLPAKQENQV